MQKNGRRSPKVEALDARTLLSGVAAAIEPVPAGPALQLAGSLHGIAITHGGDTQQFAAKGDVSPLGNVKTAGGGDLVTATTQIPNITGPNANYSLLTPVGKVSNATARPPLNGEDGLDTGRRTPA